MGMSVSDVMKVIKLKVYEPAKEKSTGYFSSWNRPGKKGFKDLDKRSATDLSYIEEAGRLSFREKLAGVKKYIEDHSRYNQKNWGDLHGYDLDAGVPLGSIPKGYENVMYKNFQKSKRSVVQNILRDSGDLYKTTAVNLGRCQGGKTSSIKKFFAGIGKDYEYEVMRDFYRSATEEDLAYIQSVRDGRALLQETSKKSDEKLESPNEHSASSSGANWRDPSGSDFESFLRHDAAKSGMNAKLLDNWYNSSLATLSEQSKKYKDSIEAMTELGKENSKNVSKLIQLNRKMFSDSKEYRQEMREDRSAILSYMKQDKDDTIKTLMSEGKKSRRETTNYIENLISGYVKNTDGKLDSISKILKKYDAMLKRHDVRDKKQTDLIKSIAKDYKKSNRDLTNEIRSIGKTVLSTTKSPKKTTKSSTKKSARKRSTQGILEEIKENTEITIKNQSAIMDEISPGHSVRSKPRVESGPIDELLKQD